MIKDTTLEICWEDSPRRFTFLAVSATVSRRFKMLSTVRSMASVLVWAVVEALRATSAA